MQTHSQVATAQQQWVVPGLQPPCRQRVGGGGVKARHSDTARPHGHKRTSARHAHMRSAEPRTDRQPSEHAWGTGSTSVVVVGTGHRRQPGVARHVLTWSAR